uniref:Putative secreted protein n=1 Tax=Xenopsylla cheopis TaxID=163159 RepID=A0A6M2DXY3_XENCH
MFYIHISYLSSCSFARSALLMPTFFNSSIKSPDWCICNKISQPPTNSPDMYTCGIVGQLEYSLIPRK